jgi:hypothetical protein
MCQGNDGGLAAHVLNEQATNNGHTGPEQLFLGV